jgi:hypothetical protein
VQLSPHAHRPPLLRRLLRLVGIVLVMLVSAALAASLTIELMTPGSPEKAVVRNHTPPEFREKVMAGGQEYNMLASNLLTENYGMTAAELLVPSGQNRKIKGLIVISTALQVWPDRSFVPSLMGSYALLMLNTVRAQDISFGNALPPLEMGLKNIVLRLSPIGRLDNFIDVRTAFHRGAGNIIHHIHWAKEVLAERNLSVSLIGYGAGALPATRAALALQNKNEPPSTLALVFPPEGLRHALSPVYGDSSFLIPFFWRRLDVATNIAKIKSKSLLILAAAADGGADKFSPYAKTGEAEWIALTDPMQMRRAAQIKLRDWLVRNKVLEEQNGH